MKVYSENEMNKDLKEKYEDLKVILYSSKEFKFKNNHVLILKEYYGHREVELDLSKIDEDMFKEIYCDPEKEKEEDYDLY